MTANGSITASWLELDRQVVPKNFRAEFRFFGEFPRDFNFDVLAIELLKI